MVTITSAERVVMNFIFNLLLDKKTEDWKLEAENLDEYSKKHFEASDYFKISQVGVGTGMDLKIENDSLDFDDYEKYLVVYEDFQGCWATVKALSDYNVTWKMKSEVLHNQLLEELEKEKKVHNLKILPKYFQDVVNGKKKFELRENDRTFKVGDLLNLQEYDLEKQAYTGREVTARVTYLLGDFIGLKENYVALGISDWRR